MSFVRPILSANGRAFGRYWSLGGQGKAAPRYQQNGVEIYRFDFFGGARTTLGVRMDVERKLGSVVQKPQVAGSSNLKFEYFRRFWHWGKQDAILRERRNVRGREVDIMASKYGDIAVRRAEERRNCGESCCGSVRVTKCCRNMWFRPFQASSTRGRK